MQTLHARVEGRVQGVFFRDSTRREAQHLGLTGWVKNMPDGTVETVLQGDEKKLKEMKNWLQKGSPHSIVTNVSYTEIDDEIRYSDFTILC
jgi:acylphosphatase